MRRWPSAHPCCRWLGLCPQQDRGGQGAVAAGAPRRASRHRRPAPCGPHVAPRQRRRPTGSRRLRSAGPCAHGHRHGQAGHGLGLDAGAPCGSGSIMAPTAVRTSRHASTTLQRHVSPGLRGRSAPRPPRQLTPPVNVALQHQDCLPARSSPLTDRPTLAGEFLGRLWVPAGLRVGCPLHLDANPMVALPTARSM